MAPGGAVFSRGRGPASKAAPAPVSRFHVSICIGVELKAAGRRT